MCLIIFVPKNIQIRTNDIVENAAIIISNIKDAFELESAKKNENKFKNISTKAKDIPTPQYNDDVNEIAYTVS
ncbi:hypothetical protein ACXYFN_01490 [Mycoplasma sp. 48589B]